MVSVFITAEELISKFNSDEKTPIIVDARWHDPVLEELALSEFLSSHIPGACLFYLEVESDLSTSIPHTMPGKQQMQEMLRSMNIGRNDSVVVYEDSILCTSARFWFMLKVYGFENVRILSGGIKAWSEHSFPIEVGPSKDNESNKEAYPLEFQKERIVDKITLKKMMQANECQLIDARSEERFQGKVPEARPGLRQGCVPNSINIPFLELSTEKTQISSEEFQSILKNKGIDINKPIVTMCGSGVTACILIALFEEIGVKNVMLYDGSWSEWGLIA